MVELSYKTLSGLVVLILTLASTATYYIADTGRDRKCSIGWELVTDGTYEGKYMCKDRPDIYYYCYRIRDSANTKNYWCDEGEIIDLKEQPDVVISDANKIIIKGYECDNADTLTRCTKGGVEKPISDLMEFKVKLSRAYNGGTFTCVINPNSFEYSNCIKNTGQTAYIGELGDFVEP